MSNESIYRPALMTGELGSSVISPKGAPSGCDSAVPVVTMTDSSAEECLRTRQYLRRVRIPRPDSLPTDLKDELRQSFRRRDFASLDTLAQRAYGIEQLLPLEFTNTRR